ncbi:hypothetical protein ACWGHM_10390 [Streptomyces sp. NPDC054904]|uniref:hypothetical protein n=1 Tax=Streptomyces sp. NPDC090054 TaxID=3365933 RepID=UPI003822B5B0
MDQKHLAELHARAEAEFTRIPGVVGVGFGLKEVRERTTERRALRVYVRDKKPLSDIPADEVLPTEFEGFPVDVLVVREIRELHCEDVDQHDPLIGGITITGFKNIGGSFAAGTLGFFATLNGAPGPKNVVLVSNHHVLMAGAAAKGDTVYQPRLGETASGPAIEDSSKSRWAIAEIHDSGRYGNHSFAYPGETARNYYVDAATALLDISISSWCHSNCGVSYKNEIRGLDIGGNSKIADVARVVQADLDAPGDYVVYKVGRTTSKTVGRIVDIAAATTGRDRVIEIEATQPNCNGALQFADHGDSGSALINAQNRLVGLLYGLDDANPTRAFACHIHPVMDRLKITPVSLANPPVGPAGQARDDRTVVLDGEQASCLQLRQRAMSTTRGAEIYPLFEELREEMVGLVNHHRPATIAWHRGKGPAYLAHLAENARHPGHPIPFEIDGVTRRDLLVRLADAFDASGSPGLRAAVAAHRDELLQLIDDFDDLHELVGRFEGQPADV